MNNKTILTSLIYKLLERTSVQGIAFIVNIVLARLLVPSDYGVLTILTIFISLSQVFVQSGLNTALIQRKDVTDVDYSTVFFISLVMAFILYGILFVSAPLISMFYHMPELTSTLRVLSLVLIPGALNSIQNAKIAKEMQFKKLLISSIIATIISGGIGIYMAYMGYGLWALVAQQLSNQLTICIVMWFTVKWRPKIMFSIARAKILFSYGWKLLISGLLDTLYQNLRGLVVGKKYTSDTLGYYTRGQQFPQLVISNINSSIQTVMLPALSAEQEDKIRVKAMMRRSITISVYIIFPLMTGLMAVAEPLVVFLLTDKWLPCVPFLQLSCIIFAVWPLHTANLQAINAMGRSDIYLKLEIVKKIMGIIVLFISVFCFKSVMAIIIGEVLTVPIGLFINVAPNKKLLSYSFLEQIKDILPALVLSVIMGICVWLLSLIEINMILLLLLQITIGMVIYLVLSKIFKVESYTYIISILKRFVGKNSKK